MGELMLGLPSDPSAERNMSFNKKEGSQVKHYQNRHSLDEEA
jgi:hypothetical protein